MHNGGLPFKPSEVKSEGRLLYSESRLAWDHKTISARKKWPLLSLAVLSGQPTGYRFCITSNPGSHSQISSQKQGKHTVRVSKQKVKMNFQGVLSCLGWIDTNVLTPMTSLTKSPSVAPAGALALGMMHTYLTRNSQSILLGVFGACQIAMHNTLRKEVLNLIHDVSKNVHVLRENVHVLRENVHVLSEKFDKHVSFIPQQELAREITIEFWKKRRSDGRAEHVAHGLAFRYETDFYILSAAHVFADMMILDEEDFDVEVRTRSGHSQRITITDWYIPMQYVQSGAYDVGVARIQATLQFDSTKNIEISPNSGRTVHGKSTFEINGRVVAVVDDRALIHAPSQAGVSGTPILNDDCRLHAVVHGADKHRCHRHLSGDVSAHVYVDLLSQKRLLRVCDTRRRLVSACENLSDEVLGASDTTVKYEETDLPSCLRNIMDLALGPDWHQTRLKDITLRTVMEDAARVTFSQASKGFDMPGSLEVLTWE